MFWLEVLACSYSCYYIHNFFVNPQYELHTKLSDIAILTSKCLYAHSKQTLYISVKNIMWQMKLLLTVNLSDLGWINNSATNNR